MTSATAFESQQVQSGIPIQSRNGNEKTVGEGRRRPGSIKINSAASSISDSMHSNNNQMPSPLLYSSNIPSNARSRRTYPDLKSPIINNSQNTPNNTSNISNNTTSNNTTNPLLMNQLLNNKPAQPLQKSPPKNNNNINNNLSQSPPSYILKKQSSPIGIANLKKYGSSPAFPPTNNNNNTTNNNSNNCSFSFPFSRQSVSRPLPANRPRSYARIVKDETQQA